MDCIFIIGRILEKSTGQRGFSRVLLKSTCRLVLQPPPRPSRKGIGTMSPVKKYTGEGERSKIGCTWAKNALRTSNFAFISARGISIKDFKNTLPLRPSASTHPRYSYKSTARTWTGGMGWPRRQNNDKIALRQGCSRGISMKL